MTETAPSFLSAWSSFYVMTGSSAAALTGLVFVVITLVMGTERSSRSEAGISTFSTPTVVHFGAALFVSAALAAPWERLGYIVVLVGLTGAFGIVYVLRLARRKRTLTTYEPDLEDWICYDVLPLVAYAVMLAAAIALTFAPRIALFAIAGGTLMLIFLGIRNSWDIVTYIAISLSKPEPDSDEGDTTAK